MGLLRGTRRSIIGGRISSDGPGIQFFAENDGINFQSGANIDDLPSGDCTIEFWAKIPADVVNTRYVLSKSSNTLSAGFGIVTVTANGRLRMRFKHDTTDVTADVDSVFDNVWHHVAYDWEVATLTLRSFRDGVLGTSRQAVGSYLADAAYNFIIDGLNSVGNYGCTFSIGPIRLSNSRRYTGASFTLPARKDGFANDANAQLVANMTDGSGVTVTDTSGNGYDGTIAFGANTRWL